MARAAALRYLNLMLAKYAYLFTLILLKMYVADDFGVVLEVAVQSIILQIYTVVAIGN